jgi:uncharacterized protein YjbJ (UPF0337 family)
LTSSPPQRREQNLRGPNVQGVDSNQRRQIQVGLNLLASLQNRLRAAEFPEAAEPRRDYDTMSKNRIEGAAKEAVGAIKQAAGKAVGNERLQVEGAVEKAAGKMQNIVGKAQDKIGNALKK